MAFGAIGLKCAASGSNQDIPKQVREKKAAPWKENIDAQQMGIGQKKTQSRMHGAGSNKVRKHGRTGVRKEGARWDSCSTRTRKVGKGRKGTRERREGRNKKKVGEASLFVP